MTSPAISRNQFRRSRARNPNIPSTGLDDRGGLGERSLDPHAVVDFHPSLSQQRQGFSGTTHTQEADQKRPGDPLTQVSPAHDSPEAADLPSTSDTHSVPYQPERDFPLYPERKVRFQEDLTPVDRNPEVLFENNGSEEKHTTKNLDDMLITQQESSLESIGGIISNKIDARKNQETTTKQGSKLSKHMQATFLEYPKLGKSITKLALAFDIGTTCSTVSYCILEPSHVPEILAVERFPAHESFSPGSKLPSLLYYDKSGMARAAGFEALTKSAIKDALTEGWLAVEQWKHHLYPKHSFSSINHGGHLPPLPPGKTVVDVLTDFIKYLFQCTKVYMMGVHALTWSIIEDSIDFIFTHPNGSEGIQHTYRQAIKRAGLVPDTPEGESRIHMLTEGEASLHFSITTLQNVVMTSPQGVVTIDAGATSIKLCMFSMTRNPISCEEIAPAKSRPEGSSFVIHQAMALLKKKLRGWEFASEERISEIIRKFRNSTMLLIRSNQERVYIKVASSWYNNSMFNIASGKLMLTGEEATGLFNDSIDGIINAFEEQLNYVTVPMTTAFFFGGLSTTPWVNSQLRSYFRGRNIKLYRPGTHTKKVVTYGALLYHINLENGSMIRKFQPDAYEMIARTINGMKPSYDFRAMVALQTLESLREREEDSANRIRHFENENQSLRAVLYAHEQKQHCETLYVQGRVNDAAESFIKMLDTASDAVRTNQLFTEFAQRCISRLEITGDEASKANKHEEAVIAYSNVVSLGNPTHKTALARWAGAVLEYGSWSDALAAATKFKCQKFIIFHAICDALEGSGRVTEAVACLQRLKSESEENASVHDVQVQWEQNFQQRCAERLRRLGEVKMESRDYGAAAEQYSIMLSLNLIDRGDIFIRRSRARALLQSWDEALSDADEVIKLDPSCHRGYEVRHDALHGAGRYAEAVEAFDTMLLKLNQSSDHDTRKLRLRFVDPRHEIRSIVEDVIRPVPRVLIDTATGRLHDKQQQAEAFEALPIFHELVSSMTTKSKLDRDRIRGVVQMFYRYVMLSHKWESGEPLHQQVMHIPIYDLEPSLANTKLQKFCSLARGFGFRWAWSDTCCVDKLSNVILQESLVAMFTWYRGSSLTIVYLRGVPSEPRLPGGLRESIWNTRGWTYQEYVAAEIVLFYTEDWKPYLGLTLSNHKESHDVIHEMQQATGVSAKEMAVLRPGLDRVREKLFLASRRKTTLVEDAAYSLFGIFSVAIPIIYGEGNRAVGRFLDHVLTGSGDVAVLAWTGASGDYNSCLPSDLTVYDSLVPPHIPPQIKGADMDKIITKLRSSLPDISLVAELYKQLNALPLPSLAASRLKLPGISSTITELVEIPESSSEAGRRSRVYRATTSIFGIVDIQTTEDLAEMIGATNLRLVHPWIRPLLDQEFLLHDTVALDDTTRALRLVARLRQPFGALLFAPLSRVEYRRIAADSWIMAQISKQASLDDVINRISSIEIR